MFFIFEDRFHSREDTRSAYISAGIFKELLFFSSLKSSNSPCQGSPPYHPSSFFSSETLCDFFFFFCTGAWIIIMLEFFHEAPGDWESSCQPVFWVILSHLFHLPDTFSTHAATYHHTQLSASLTTLCIHCGIPGQVHAKTCWILAEHIYFGLI